jgi:16S rRNA (guanine(966)-N(2))-methyltransferase RsmD
MRVITGTARGKRLKKPADQSIRPTTDLVKESIFNIIQYDIEGRSVLDLFGGTGQLAIEAISRGAKSAVIVDNSSAAAKLITENIALTGLKDIRLIRSDALRFLENAEKFDLIFLDPPYHSTLLYNCLQKIIAFDKLNVGGIIICESSNDRAPDPVDYPYEMLKSYRYGTVLITLYTRQDQSADPRNP